MLASALILFREVFEAALIIGIVMAATKEVMGRTRWVLFGIGRTNVKPFRLHVSL